MSTEVSNKIATLPNLISFIRLLLVPVFGVLLVMYENNAAAFIVFLIAAATDFVDGAVARATGQVSRFGQRLDPLVDRVLILTAIVLVFIVGRVPFWVLLLIVARDISMLVLIGQLRKAGQQEFKVVFIGKAATAVIMAGFCMLILGWPEVSGLGLFNSDVFPGWGDASASLGIWFLYLGVVLAWAAGIFYMLQASVRSKDGGGTPHQRNQSQGEGVRGGARGSIHGGASNGTNSIRSGQGKGYLEPRRNNHGSALPSSRQQHSMHAISVKKEQAGGFNREWAQVLPDKNTWQNKKARGIVPTVFVVLDTPVKKLIAFGLALFVVVALGFYAYDSIRNFGVIHSGVRVGTVDVGNMPTSEAAALLNSNLNEVAASAPVTLFVSKEAAAGGVNNNTQELGNGVNTYSQTEDSQKPTSWSTTLATFDAAVDGNALAQEAYGIGRGGDYLPGRFVASTFGVTISPRLEFSSERLVSVERMLTETIGTPMKNADISFDGSSFVAKDGNDGFVVDDSQFSLLLQKAFFSDERAVVVPMVDRAMQVTLEDAKKVAAATDLAIAESVSVSYGDDTWQLSSKELGQYISTTVKQDGPGRGHLVAEVNADLLEAKLPEVTGHIEDQIAPLNAEFVVVEGELEIVPSQNGTGVDYKRLASELNFVLFGSVLTTNDEDGVSNKEEGLEDPERKAAIDAAAEERAVPLHIDVSQPVFKTSDAEAYGFTTKISEYTIEFGWPSHGTVVNIQTAAAILNSSIIAPGGIWSFNETAGECTEDKGFVTARVILGDEYVDEIGGGVCSVASSVFNAAYEAGYPIVERTNHSLRIDRYPAGRDAAIAYPYADLKFQNDTENYLLLTMSYTEHNVTCTLWGVPPGYVVVSESGELLEEGEFPKKEVKDDELSPGQSYIDQAGIKASRIEVSRMVYDSEGNLKEKKTFFSSYAATPEITKVGPPKEQ